MGIQRHELDDEQGGYGTGGYGGEWDRTRSADDMDAALGKMTDAEDAVPAEVVAEGKAILAEVKAKLGNRVITRENMLILLYERIRGTQFEGANFEIREYQPSDDQPYEHMYVMVGDYHSGNAYNVWFERKDRAWTIALNKIDSQGNYR